MAECKHEWGEWEEVPVWYTSAGTFKGEFRKCKKCPQVESRNLEVSERPGVINPTIGIFAAMFNEKSEGGKLLIKKIETGRYAGEWDLPGGGVVAKNATQALNEEIIATEVCRQMREEIGISLPIPLMPQMFPAVLKGGGDWAFVIPITKWHVNSFFQEAIKGEVKFVSPEELRELAEGPEGNRLLSGWGKRMCRLCLQGFYYSPNPKYRRDAKKMLKEIQEGWK